MYEELAVESHKQVQAMLASGNEHHSPFPWLKVPVLLLSCDCHKSSGLDNFVFSLMDALLILSDIDIVTMRNSDYIGFDSAFR